MAIAIQKLKFRSSHQRSVVKGKILVVEDSADQWTILQKAFKQVNPHLQLIRAEDMQELAALLQESIGTQTGLPWLILLDLYLPRRHDGWQMLETIQHSAPSDIPVFILTSSTDLEGVIDAFQQGIRCYLIKPKTLPDWLECCNVLNDYLEGRRL
ncbi:response regulator [Larkinella rosea]|uniref:Response regulator n=1 Tax=Larkinella rosea TaxID=2025312 RepID=A0A3P1C7V9_9BACT|nr:response regulator [Larkinella rosea]RRB09357.1 response regulator [Larkinella rosea]